MPSVCLKLIDHRRNIVECYIKTDSVVIETLFASDTVMLLIFKKLNTLYTIYISVPLLTAPIEIPKDI